VGNEPSPLMTTILKMQSRDIDSVTQIHLLSFKGFFLSFLGYQFLAELYDGIVSDPNGIAFVANSDNGILGFVAGTDSPQGFYRRLLRQRWWRFAWAAAWPALRKPSIIHRLLRAFSRSRSEDIHENCATLMSIAVAPDAQGQGIGQQLVQAFLVEVKARGIKQVNLTTDAENNAAANQFYVKQGFTLHKSFVTPEGRRMNEYMIEL